MATAEARGLTIEALRRALRTVDPRAVLVSPRVLRRVIRGAPGLGRLGLRTPHASCFVATGRAALAHAERDELRLTPDEPEPDFLILLPEPSEGYFKESSEDVLRIYWRSLFHARVHLAYLEKRDESREVGSWLSARIERLGQVAFAEARAVLVEDCELVLPAEDRAVYEEFAASYLERLAFRPESLERTFPAIRDHDEVREWLCAEVEFDRLLDAARPPGVADRIRPPASEVDELGSDEAAERPSPRPGRWRRLVARAEAASDKGNNVRAAILKARASRVAPAREGPRTLAGARSELESLSRRLRAAVGFEPDEAARWRRALPTLLDRASRGVWPREARLLYDLQKACSDHERSVFKVDLLGWAFTLGRRPLGRPLPAQAAVLVLEHLRSAEGRVRGLRGLGPAADALRDLVAGAIRRRRLAIRERFRGPVVEALDRVGLAPANLPERASRRKLVEELLDRIVDRGYLRIGDLRDAVSRNQVKLHDLLGVGEFLRGDALLRADVELSRALAGVYHRGEVYLRALQRASSLAFGTKLGRGLSLLVALPLGVAFVALEGLQHLVAPIVHAFRGVEPELFNPVALMSVASVVFGLVNIPAFRFAFVRAMKMVGRALKAIFYHAPAVVLRLPLIREVVSNRTFLLAWNWLIRPLVYVALLALFIPRIKDQDAEGLILRSMVVVVIALLINTRRGRDVEEIATDGATRLGQRLWTEAIPNLFRGIMDFFKAALEAVERALYEVDQWLRFRGGQGRLTLLAKGVFGLFWFVVAYLARIYVNLLIEPQVNPIKHFPVVTVSHKLMLPMIKTVFVVIKAPLLPLGEWAANSIAGTTLFLLPGFFGFLVWELKENWRLYAANRPKALQPVSIGHHGETMSRFLRPGFHSGTVPKLFARLRKADRRAEGGEGPGPTLKAADALHHVGEAVRSFVERGVLALLEESRSIGPTKLIVADVSCATNRIVVGLVDESSGTPVARVSFEERDRRLVARVDDSGGLASMAEEPRRALTTALAGLYAMSNVDLAADPRDDASTFDFRAAPVAWEAWVRAWEDDRAGRGQCPVIPAGIPLLPEPGVIEPSPAR